MSGLSAIAIVALCIALSQGVHGRTLTGRHHTAIGYLPRHLAAEKEPTPLSLDILDPAESPAEAVVKATALHAALNSEKDKTLYNLFFAWAEAHEEYYSSEEEAQEAYEGFINNLEHMVHHNLLAEDHGHWRGLNKWSGRKMFSLKRKFSIAGKCKNSTIGQKVAGCKQVAGAEPPKFNTAKPFPKQVSWRKKGFTTPVKQQGGGCNSAWANAAASSVDATVSIQIGTTPISIARQALLSCINNSTMKGKGTGNSEGCTMGTSDDVFNFLNMNTAPPETKYPYTSGNGDVSACVSKYLNLSKSNPEKTQWVQDKCPPTDCGKSGATYYKAGSSTFTLYAVGGGELNTGGDFSGQPVVVYWSFLNDTARDGNGPCGAYDCDFLNYQGGVFTGKACPVVKAESSDINHAMVVVGYNISDYPNDNTTGYWILQNSFGSSWGEGGLIRVSFSWTMIGTCGMYARIMAPTMNFTGGNLPKKPSRFVQGTTMSNTDYCASKYKKASQVRFCKGDRVCYTPEEAINFCPEL